MGRFLDETCLMKYVVVTGVSAGIGRGSVKVLIQKGSHVFGSVRKQADADSLIEEFGDKVTPLIFDATDAAAVKLAADQVKSIVGDTMPSGVDNNAGIAVTGPMMHIAIDE
jgi:NADP-dependent 3-hydroxy acid dehydrogenase YdfG